MITSFSFNFEVQVQTQLNPHIPSAKTISSLKLTYSFSRLQILTA